MICLCRFDCLGIAARIVDASFEAAGDLMQNSGLQKEMAHLEKKQLANRLHEYLAGALVESDVTPEIAVLAKQVQQNWAKLDAGRVAKAKAMSRVMRPHWSFDDRSFIFLEGVGGSVAKKFGGMKVTGLRSGAEIFVTPNPASASVLTRWTAALQGGVISDPTWALSRGDSGVAFAYEAATHIQRKIYLSDQFDSEHGAFARALRHAMSLGKSKWGSLSSWRQFAEASEKAKKQKKHKTVIALAVSRTAEQMSKDNIMSLHQFLEFISKVSCLKRGVCDL